MTNTLRAIAVGAATAILITAGLSAQRKDKLGREIDPNDVNVPDGYHIEAVVANLNVPTTAIFDGDDLIVAESGFKDTGKPRVLRVKRDGSTQVLASDGLNAPVTGLAMHDNRLYVSHAGKVSVVEGKSVRDIVTGLPVGDHSNDKIVFGKDGNIYMGQGTVTNAGVVGVDNYLFGWLKDHPDVHETPCKDVTLVGENFETENPLTDANDKVTTGAYKPFGTPSTPGEVIHGSPKCGGSIVRFRPDGSNFELVAWGLRNPFGVAFDASGQLWTTFHGTDVRGSRNIYNDPDYLVKVEQGAWYGWPDFFAGQPVTDNRFNAPDKGKPKFLLQEHPPVAKAFATFASHTGTNGLAFSPGKAFGFDGDAFVAAYGTFAPVTSGVNMALVGFGVLRVDMKTGEIHDFVKNDLPGPAYLNQQDGLNRPSDVLFGPDGSMYIVDFGGATLDTRGLMLKPETGIVWRVYHDGQQPLMTSGAPIVPPANAMADIRQEQPMVPNVSQTYKMVSSTLAFVVGVLVVLIAAVVVLWRTMRRRRAAK
jgi:glucose/arabinose dehydrogenase